MNTQGLMPGQSGTKIVLTIQSRPLSVQQSPSSGFRTLPAPFPNRTPLGNQHVTSTEMTGVVKQMDMLSTDQNAMYDDLLSSAIANLDPRSAAGQRGCVQHRYVFGCGCAYQSPACTCCRQDMLVLPSPAQGFVQVEETQFAFVCAACTLLSLDVELEFARQRADEAVSVWDPESEEALEMVPECEKQVGRYEALVARVKNEWPVVEGWTRGVVENRRFRARGA